MKIFLKFIAICLGIFIIQVLVISVFLIIFENAEKETIFSQESIQDIVSHIQEPEISVNANQLIKDYETNEMAADKLYKGKILQVTGIVSSIDSSIDDTAEVQLSGGNWDLLGFVIASGDQYFDEYAMSLKKGQTITITCRSDGEVMSFPVLVDCKPQ